MQIFQTCSVFLPAAVLEVASTRAEIVARVSRAGHSLGGALATLAAFDLKSRFRQLRVHVYTFGAPRTGNNFFARRASAVFARACRRAMRAAEPCHGCRSVLRRPSHLTATLESNMCTNCRREHESMVPDTWSVVQERDIIPQAAKFAVLNKRPGARVIVNGRGACVVQPTPLDLHVQAGGVGSRSSHIRQVLCICPLQPFVCTAAQPGAA